MMKAWLLTICFCLAVVGIPAQTISIPLDQRPQVMEWKIKQAELEVQKQKLEVDYLQDRYNHCKPVLQSGAVPLKMFEQLELQLEQAKLTVTQLEYKVEELKALAELAK